MRCRRSSAYSRFGRSRERRDVWILRGLDRRGLVVRIRVIGEARGLEQRRVLAPEAARAGGGRGAPDRPRPASAQLPIARVDAVQRAQELQRLGLSEVPGQSLGMAGARAAAQSERRELADQDRVVSVPGRLERVPHLAGERAIHSGRDRRGRPVDRLGPEVFAEVWLVPDRPKVHTRQRGALARAGCKCRCSVRRRRGRTGRTPAPMGATPRTGCRAPPAGSPVPQPSGAHRRSA